MKPSFSLTSLLACALWSAGGAALHADTSPYRGLWVGEVRLGKVNEVTVPLDAQNVPRAPDPNIPTPTFDAASLRLIVHVDAAGRASLLKQVAILARKSDFQAAESDMALVTDERLYGSFPPQAARRISSVAFDFGDAQATAAVNQIIEQAALGAAQSSASSNDLSVIRTAASSQAGPLVAKADVAKAFTDFLRDHLDAAKVRAIATGGSSAAARTAAFELKNASFYGDSRGIEMLDAIDSALAALPPGATPAEKERAALNTAAAFVETDRAYDRFLAGELVGDAIRAAAEQAASVVDTLSPTPVTDFQSLSSGSAVAVISPAHGLVTGDEIAILGAGISAYNGLRKVTRIDADRFQIDTPFVDGGDVDGYAPSTQVAPLVITSPGHGLTDGMRISIRDSLAGYNGRHIVTVIDADHFSVPVAFSSDPSNRGVWSLKSGDIVKFEGTGGAAAGVKITSPNHGLNNGQVIEIQGSGQASYNGLKTITRIDADSFSIPLAFGGNPAITGSWDLPVEIGEFSPPATAPTLVESPAHGLATGDRIVISAAGNDLYNAEHEVTVVDADHFSIPVLWDGVFGDPAAKGEWEPAAGAQWRKTAAIRAALDQVAKVAEARTTALNVKLTGYSDSRAPDAIESILEAVIAESALSDSPLVSEISRLADAAGRAELADSVLRYPSPTHIPSADYTAFVRSPAFAGAVATAADAAADAALKEKSNILHTLASRTDRAKEAAINALAPVLATAARSLLTELPMSGDFAGDLAAQIMLPAHHPTNPFRHRRHPDHTSGIDIRRDVRLSFLPYEGQLLTRTGYGVDRISGTYSEEIHGLHKPLGPSQNIGLKVSGSFQLFRISQIDTLNGR